MEGDKRNLADLLKDGGVSDIPDFIGTLPMAVKKRVCALKKFQLDSIEVEAKFYERVHQLEKEFEAEFNKLYEQRRKIVAGEYEPNDEESKLPIIHGLEENEIKVVVSSSRKRCKHAHAVLSVQHYHLSIATGVLDDNSSLQ
ncbi:nucleosome assembly protein [Ancylostoma duodenale]|uniref:Nucleosome assembly protein n=1 Tax=Ancylostoma duodenale TaxID=51022 RepID=A0A0C2E0Y8_9BILA|nr:nucleosome assembly protein [Ancylostoma duodenale]